MRDPKIPDRSNVPPSEAETKRKNPGRERIL